MAVSVSTTCQGIFFSFFVYNTTRPISGSKITSLCLYFQQLQLQAPHLLLANLPTPSLSFYCYNNPLHQPVTFPISYSQHHPVAE